jgi:hypothetical protein
MNQFNEDDIVHIGKGKVEYRVGLATDAVNGFPYIVSGNTGKGKFEDPAKLVLINAGAVTLAEETEKEADAQAQAAREALEAAKRAHQTSSYGRSILAALQLKAHVFAGAVFPTKRRAKNRVAKASRKANR